MTQREIKFRAWVKSAKAIATWDQLVKECDRLSIFSYEDMIMLEFTGLIDRKGIEIYEGDRVKFHYFYQSLGQNLGAQESEHELTGEVRWGTYGWCIAAIKGQHFEGYTGYNSGEGESSIMDLYAMNESGIHEESFEVIGTIFDTPITEDKTI